MTIVNYRYDLKQCQNINALQASSCIIWLKASVGAIVSRIQDSSAAQYEIDTDQLTPEQVAERVIAIWKERSIQGS